LVAGKPDDSRIIQVVRYPDDDYQMPPKAKLAAEQIAALEEWVKNGAVWPASAISPDAVPTAPDAWKTHWAFQPVTKPEPPAVKNSAWVKSPVDQFVAAKLEEKGLAPSPVADRRTLIRRVTFGL